MPHWGRATNARAPMLGCSGPAGVRSGGVFALPPALAAVDHGVEMRLGVEGGPADGREVLVQAGGHGRPPGQLELAGVLYVLRMFGADPHPRAEWHYCWLRP